MSQQDQTSPPSPVSPNPAAQAPKPPEPVSSGFWSRFTIPLFAVLMAFAFIALATLRWDEGDQRLSRLAPVHYWDTDIRHFGRSMNVQG